MDSTREYIVRVFSGSLSKFVISSSMQRDVAWDRVRVVCVSLAQSALDSGGRKPFENRRA